MRVKSKVKFDKRPMCSCGCKMKLIEYEGYYEEFKFWQCDNCDIEQTMNDHDADRVFKGSYR